jgi:LacI family transcriptional regulator
MTVTLRDVAAKAGVSAITVSRALNNTGHVSPQTRRRILDAVAALNYVPNDLASSLRSKRTQLLALLVTDVTNPFWTTVARGVEDAAMQAGYGVILCNTDEDPGKEARYLDLLLRRRIDGLIIGPTNESTEILQNLKGRNVPFVLIDRLVSGVSADSVRGDSRGGAYQLTMHLLQTGYRRIGLISGPVAVSTSEDRVAGYTDALNEIGVPYDPDLIRCGGYRESWGYEATLALLARDPRPDALFAANNFIALGVLKALRSLGLRVPEDVALVCFDDFPQVTAAAPFLTTAIQPAAEIGSTAIDLLLDRLANPDLEFKEIVMPTQLLVHSSCGCGTHPAASAQGDIAGHNARRERKTDHSTLITHKS